LKLQNRIKEEPTVDLTSLIDVVFLLLLFFMVSTTFEHQAVLKVDLPEASAVDAPIDLPERLELVIDANGLMFLNDRQLVDSDERTIKAALNEAVGDDRDLPLILRADRETPHHSGLQKSFHRRRPEDRKWRMTGTGNSSKGKPGTGSTALRAYKRLWAYTKRYLWMFLLGVAGVSVDASMQAAFIKFMEPLIDRVFVGKDSEYGLWLAGIIFLVAIARMVGNFVGVYGMEWVGRKVVADLRQELFNQYVSLPASYYDRNSSGQLISKLAYNSEQVANAATRSVIAAFRDIISHRIQDSMGNVSHVTEEAVVGQQVVKVFQGQEVEKQRFDSVNEKTRRLHMRMVATRLASSSMVQLAAGLALVLLMIVATRPSMLNEISAGTFTVVFWAMIGTIHHGAGAGTKRHCRGRKHF